MKRSYCITGIGFNGNRVSPIYVERNPDSHIGHIHIGTIWIMQRYGHIRRKLFKRFVNSEYQQT